MALILSFILLSTTDSICSNVSKNMTDLPHQLVQSAGLTSFDATIFAYTVAHTEGFKSPQEEQSALSLPEEGISVMRPAQFIVDLDPKVT